MPMLRLDASDEYMHPLEEARNFNESMYFNVYDPAVKIGGFFRLGNRPNEGYAEMTTCLYLPDGRVAFTFARPEISSNDAFDAGGMRFEVREPLRELTVTYDGRVALLTDPLTMADPKRAFAESPWVDCAVRLRYTSTVPLYGGELVNDDGSPLPEAGGDFARGHYDQHVRAGGTIRVSDQEWTISGFGLRDHSWGPRFWQSPLWYRWLTGNFGADGGFVVSIIASRDGSRRTGGMILTDEQYEPLTHAEISTEWEGPASYHRRIHTRARTAARTYDIEGRVLSLIPLRNRRTTPDGEQLMTRISEGMTEWRCGGLTGYGLSEYLDQIVDGRPVGIAS